MEDFNEKQEIPSPIVDKSAIETLGEKSEQEIIDTLKKAAVVNEVQNDDKTKNDIMKHAHKTIANRLEEISAKNSKDAQVAYFEANKDACVCYGIERQVPIWQTRLMKFGHSFWFFIYWVVATLTICPVNVFAKGLKAFFKHSWLAITLAILLYLFIAFGIPFIISRYSVIQEMLN